MIINLTPQQQSFVAACVSRGEYPTEQAVLSSAINLLQQRENVLAKIDEGDRQLRTGNFSEYGEADRDRFVSDIARISMSLSKVNQAGA
jgi:Arc/MetJ-type ribon-helix-helix transcriptional regulator